MSDNTTAAPNKPFNGNMIPPLPSSPGERKLEGLDPLPFGDYANINPASFVYDSLGVMQSNARYHYNYMFCDAEMGCNHKQINTTHGVKSDIEFSNSISLATSLTCWAGMALFLTAQIWNFIADEYFPGLLYSVFMFIAVFGLLGQLPSPKESFARFVIQLLDPIIRWMERSMLRSRKKESSTYSRLTGYLTLYQGEEDPVFSAPFVEFDAYAKPTKGVTVGDDGYCLVLLHRTARRLFFQTPFSSEPKSLNEVHAQWDMLQRYMDQSQPLPDIPCLERFRQRDEVTAEHDKITGRDRDYWSDKRQFTYNIQSIVKEQDDYPWEKKECHLTPRLGMADNENTPLEPLTIE